MTLKKQIELAGLLLGVIFSMGCKKDSPPQRETVSGFTKETKVRITGYESDAMEPFLSKDEHYLFFNSRQGPDNKDIYYAEKVNDTTFLFKGEVQGVNSTAVDANPTMDMENNFYFISTRDLDTCNKTLFGGVFNNGSVTGVHLIEGTINIATPFWINMGVEVSKDGNILFVSNAGFKPGESFPTAGNIRFAVKNGNEFNIPDNETDILANINTENAIQYAGELSADGLELFYSQVTLSNPPVFMLYYAKRDQINGKFGDPIPITEPFKKDPYAVVEAPTLSNDGKRLYFHKLDGDIYSVFMLSRE